MIDISKIAMSSSWSSVSSDSSGTSEDIRKTRQISLQEEIQRSHRKLSALIVGTDLLEAKHQEQRIQLNIMREHIQQLLDVKLIDKSGILVEIPDVADELLSVMATHSRYYTTKI